MSFSSVPKRLRAFWRDTDGAVSMEFILSVPIIFWAFAATFVFFDGYRQSSVNLKAAYTVSDLLSRETGLVTDEYIDSMHDLLQILTGASSPTILRVSIIEWDEDDGRYYVHWSANRGYAEALNDDDMEAIEDRLPKMPDREQIILVETRNTFYPLYKMGMGEIDLDNFVFTRLRFAPKLDWGAPA